MGKVVFISVGMSGRRNEEVTADLDRANNWLLKNIDVYRTMTNFDCQKPLIKLKNYRLWYLGEAIKKLSRCDACYFCKGWENHRGCRIEMAVCKEYGIEIILEE